MADHRAVDFGEIASLASALAAVVAVIVSILDLAERQRRRQTGREQTTTTPERPTAPPRVTVTSTASPPTPTGPPSTAWGAPPPPVDLGKVAAGVQGIAAYVFGFVGAVAVIAASRRAEARYHAWQSLGIDALLLGYLLVATIVGVAYSAARYGAEPMPETDPVLNAAVAGIFLVELGPRFYCVLQILRVKPARVPLVWRLSATLAQRGRRSA
jgi:hypothetical protein